MPLEYVKVIWEPEDKKGFHNIIFIKLRKKFMIQTKSYAIFNIWQELLRKRVLISDFHSEYRVLKEIGMGSFARVYYAKRIGTNNRYAVKAFTKEDLEEYKNGV